MNDDLFIPVTWLAPYKAMEFIVVNLYILDTLIFEHCHERHKFNYFIALTTEALYHMLPLKLTQPSFTFSEKF